MALFQFIKDLLYTCDNLIIPGFGGFVAQYSPARINTEKEVILPPYKQFIFNPTLIEDDGVFNNFVQFKLGVSQEEAKKEVSELVNEFWKKLNDGETIFIEGVGYFSLDDDKLIRFEKEHESNFDADSYGLSEIGLKSSQKQTKLIPDIESPKRKRPIAKILVIFLLINIIGGFAAFVYWKFEPIQTYFKHFNSSNTNISQADTNSKVISDFRDTSGLGQSLDTSTHIQKALYYEEPVKKDTTAKENVSAKFYIIAGSFQSYEKAKIHANILKKDGFSPEIIEFSQQKFRVSIGEFNTEEDAMLKLDTFKAKKGAENAWIAKK